jgi:site-specific recombinase XerD
VLLHTNGNFEKDLMKIRLEQTEYGTYRLFNSEGELIAAAQEFFKMLELKGLSAHTVRAYGYDLVALYRWLHASGREFERITAHDLLDFIAAQKQKNISPRSINRRLVTAYMYYHFRTGEELARGKGVLPQPAHYKGRGRDSRLGLHRLPARPNAQLQVKLPKTIVEPLTKTQVHTFIRTLSRYRDLCIAYLMLLCGLRSQEVRDLGLHDVSLEERQIRVHGKGNKERMLPLPDVLAQHIEHYLNFERPVDAASHSLFVILQGKHRGYKLSAEGLRSLFRHRRKKPSLANANPHRLRHTFGADMARAGIDAPVLQRLMGHEDLKTTLHYVNLSMADIAEEFHAAATAIQAQYRKQEEN